MRDGIRFFYGGALSVVAILLFFGLVIVILPLFFLGLTGAAFTRLGFSWLTALLVVLFLLAGSFVNIPVYRFRRDMIRLVPGSVTVYSSSSMKECSGIWETQVSVNLGGAVMPVFLSCYLLYRAVLITDPSLLVPAGCGVLLIALITLLITRTTAGSGTRVPLFIPGLAALLAASLFFGGAGLSAAVTAFVSGTAGTLLGGTVAQLFRIQDPGVPVVSIGGAGTFGAVFVCCVLPALIA